MCERERVSVRETNACSWAGMRHAELVLVSRHAELLLGSLLLVSQDLQLEARQGREMTNFDARHRCTPSMHAIDARHRCPPSMPARGKSKSRAERSRDTRATPLAPTHTCRSPNTCATLLAPTHMTLPPSLARSLPPSLPPLGVLASNQAKDIEASYFQTCVRKKGGDWGKRGLGIFEDPTPVELDSALPTSFRALKVVGVDVQTQIKHIHHAVVFQGQVHHICCVQPCNPNHTESPNLQKAAATRSWIAGTRSICHILRPSV
jgi:hypothetical protein